MTKKLAVLSTLILLFLLPTNTFASTGTGITDLNLDESAIEYTYSDVYGDVYEDVYEDVYRDGEAPIIELIEVSPGPAIPGEEITIKATVTDNQSGVYYVEASINNPSVGHWDWVELSYDETEGKWVGTYLVKTLTYPGEWNVKVLAWDNAGHFALKAADQVFTIENPNEDWEAPVIENIEVSSGTVKAGEEFTIKAIVTDNQSGVDYVNVNINSDGFWDSFELTYDETEGKWVGTYLVDSNVRPGQWEIIIFAQDDAGNRTADLLDQTITIVEGEEVVESPKYGDAQWYYSLGNLYNAVHYAGVALTEGDTRQEVQGFMNSVSAELLEAAATMNYEDAMNAYELLANTEGVPAEIKAEAAGKITPEVISAKYDEAQWYYENGNLYNAVHFAGVALFEGDTRQEVQDFMSSVSAELLEAAATMNYEDAMNAYELLANTEGVPAEIKAEATGKITPEVISARYDEAQWYYENGNLYNAVHFAGVALFEGDTRQEVQDFMNSVSAELLEAAATMNYEDAMNAYHLLTSTTGVPANIKVAAEGKLID